MGKKNSLILTLIISIIGISALATYAWFTWNSPNNTELTLTIGELADVTFNTGDDINVNNIGPVLNYLENGEITTFSFRNKSELELFTNVDLNITNLPDELKEESFKYVLLSSTDNNNFNEVASGNFKDKSNGINTILSLYPAQAGTTYFKFIIYIDGTMENPIDMMGKSFSATLEVTVGEKQSVAEKIINLSQGDTWGSGASGIFATNSYTDETTGETKYHDYRYVGANVNNYVWFNNDMYRIIGVFDDNSHGVVDADGNGQYLVKLIAANQLGSYSYGVQNDTSNNYSTYSNDFTLGNMNKLLNNNFYGKSSEGCSVLTYYYNQTGFRTNDCSDIVGYGIDPSLQNYIENVTWYLYGYPSKSYSKQNFYLCERGGNSCTGANGTTEESKVKVQNKIGLMYVSDYLYASGYFSSSSTTNASSQNYGNQNWLYKGIEWTITPRSDNSSYAFYVNNIGYVFYNDASFGFGARPTFYLTSSVFITGGNGSFASPYTISME